MHKRMKTYEEDLYSGENEFDLILKKAKEARRKSQTKMESYQP
jgi:hypothetical protein